MRIFERTRGRGARAARDDGVDVVAPAAAASARARVLLATSAFPPLLRAIRRYIVPVYDYALVTEPLERRPARRDRLAPPPGASATARNQFHYYRLTADDRILFGGYDAVYRFRGPVDPRHDDHDATFARAVAALLPHVPAARGPALHATAGAARSTPRSRFSVFFGTALGGRVAYAVGYTGLGVGATRFGARVALDLLDGRETEATRLRYVRRRARSRSRRSRCAWAVIAAHPQPPRRRRPRRRAAAACGCGRSTGSGSGSTAEAPPRGGYRPVGWRTVKPASERGAVCQREPNGPSRPLVSKRRPATYMKTWPSLA